MLTRAWLGAATTALVGAAVGAFITVVCTRHWRNGELIGHMRKEGL